MSVDPRAVLVVVSQAIESVEVHGLPLLLVVIAFSSSCSFCLVNVSPANSYGTVCVA